MNKFEQLIEYVINDEDAKARELFHEIVVEKSREIYENLMQEEEVIDEESTHDEDEKTERAGRKVTKDIEYDDKKDRKKVHEAEDEDLDEAMGGDAADDLIDDVEMEEESDINMEAEDEEEEVDVDMEMGDDDMGDDHHADVGGEEELEDRVMDLEDKLEELMAEFEELMGDGGDMGDDMGDGDDFEMGAGGDAIEMDDTEEMMPEMGMRPMEEAVNLKAAPSPVTSEEGGINKKSTVAANSGARGAMAKPVHTGGEMGGSHDTAAYKNTTKDLIGKVGNTPAQGTQDPKPATKPQLGQAGGVNTKSPLPSGGRG
jgi:hypothetical protein